MNPLDTLHISEQENLTFSTECPKVIQMPYDYIPEVLKQTNEENTHLLKNVYNAFQKLSIEENIKFLKEWHGSKETIENLLHQYGLFDVRKERYGNVSETYKQRIHMIHSLLTDKPYILIIDPFVNASKENIRYFHQMFQQLEKLKKAFIIVVTKTEDLFLAGVKMYKYGDSGIKEIETEADEENSSSIRKIKARSEDKAIFIDIPDIEYIESNDGKVYVNVAREKFVIDYTLNRVEELLKSQHFYRCHRSYIVNLEKVSEIIIWSKNSYSVVLNNLEETKVPLSRNKYNEIQDKLTRY